MNFFAYLRLYKIQLVKTINCFITFLCLGGCSTLLGSSLLDIQIRVRKPFDVVTGLVPSRSIGYMIGGVVGKSNNDSLFYILFDFSVVFDCHLNLCLTVRVFAMDCDYYDNRSE